MAKTKPIVYVASPYTKGDPCINTHFQIKVFDILMDSGLVIPYVPLWSHFQHTASPRHYTDWIEYDKAIIPRLDACVRLNVEFTGRGLVYNMAQSSGADGEVKLFQELGKPVFFGIDPLLRWAEEYVCSKSNSGGGQAPSPRVATY